jgi:hypothetical protein
MSRSQTPEIHVSDTFYPLLLQLLDGSVPPWPEDPTYSSYFLDYCAAQELFALFHYGLKNAAGDLSLWPEDVRLTIQKEAGRQALVESARHSELQEMLRRLDQNRIHTLVLKGTALAYSLYPEPSLRSRCDTDLWVSEKNKDLAGEVLKTLGYETENMVRGSLISYQAMFSKTDAFGVEHIVDLHWKILNPQSAAHFLTFTEAWQEKTHLSKLSPFAYALSPRHALLYACAHLYAHHPDEDFFLWIYDLALLYHALDGTKNFYALADDKTMQHWAAQGLHKAGELFSLPFSLDERAWIARYLLAASLKGSATRLDKLSEDLSVLPPAKKAVLLKEHLFPPLDYMRRKYGFTNPVLAPFYYIWRILRGIPKLFS